MLNIRITRTNKNLTPFELIYERQYMIPQLKPFHGNDEEAEMTFSDYMKNIFSSKEVSSVNSVSGESAEIKEEVKPGDWGRLR